LCAEGSFKQRQITPLIVMLVVSVVLAVLYRLARKGVIQSNCCAKKEPVVVAPKNAGKMTALDIAPPGQEPSLTTSGADVSFVMSGGGAKTAIVFQDVSIDVGDGAKKRTILHNLTGRFESGRLSAILGPSGSGKSTCLNVLTGRINASRGQVTLNGATPLSTIQKIVGFVGQEDIMYPMLTVRQVLVDSALSRLPEVWPLNKKLALVDDVMEVLGLKKIADSVIGDATQRGISGGEKKRVSVGMELVADPAVLFCDEPTSGLDAASAKDLMAALQRVARRGLIVVAVIHQPRYEIYEMIDDLLLLRTGGHAVYLGEAAACEAYLRWLGFPLPPNCSPSDHQLDVISGRVALRLSSAKQPAAAASNSKEPESAHTPSGTWMLATNKTQGVSGSDVPALLSAAWANFRLFASAKLVPVALDTQVRCTSKQLTQLQGLFSAGTPTDSIVTLAVPQGAEPLTVPSVTIAAPDAAGPVSAENKADTIKKTDIALIEDTLAVRAPPGLLTQIWLYIKRRVLVDVRDPFPIMLDIGLQVLCGASLASQLISEEYYSPPLPLDVAETCPDLVKERCMERAVFGFVPQLNAFFITMIVCVGSSSFPVRTFGQWNNIWMRDRLGGRDLKAYFFSQVLYDLLHVTRAALYFTSIFYPLVSYRGSFGWWFLLFWLLIFAAHGVAYFVSVTVRYVLATALVIVAGVAFAITSGALPRLDVVADWWPLPIFWAVSYNRWGAEALVNLAIQTEIGAQDPAGRVGRGIRALGYNPDNFSLDFGMLFLVGVMWRVFTFLRLKYRKNTV